MRWLLAWICWLICGVAWGQVNPPIGSVWTYQGAAGTGWSAPIGGGVSIGQSSGYDGTGVTDSSGALQACLTAASTSSVRTCYAAGKVLVSGNITIPAFTTLRCGDGLPNNQDNDPTMWGGMTSSLRLGGTNTITYGGQGAGIVGCLIYRAGMTFPVGDSSGYTGTAINSGGYRDPLLRDVVIIGFDTCVNFTGSSRVNISNIKLDCSGVTKAALYAGAGSTDIGHYDNIEISPLASASVVAGCVATTRAGTGMWVDGSQSENMDGILIFFYKTAGLRLTSELPTSGPGGPQQHQIGRVWVDYVSSCAIGTSIGVLIEGGNTAYSFMNFESLVISGQQRPLVFRNIASASVTRVGYLYLNNGNGTPDTSGALDALTVEATGGGNIDIGTLLVNTTPGYAINVLDVSGGTRINVSGASLNNVRNNVEPLMSVATAMSYNPVSVGHIFSTAPTAALFGRVSAEVPKCPPLASAAALIVPQFPDCFALTGNTGITSMIGAVTPGRAFTLYVLPTGPTITEGGGISLKGGLQFVPNAGQLQMIRFRCEENSPSSTGCREEWRSQ
jgi:hypothetical protein